MQSSWIFKPKYGKDIYEKVINCFTHRYLNWYDNGVDIQLFEIKNGYVEMQAVIDDPSCHEYFTENCFSDNPLDGEELTEHMMILLVEAGVAYNIHQDEPDETPKYILEDVEVCQVLDVLCEKDTNIYSPWGSKCWVYPVGGGLPKTVDMLDALLTLQAA
jgi:hypothetical protein